MTETWKRFLSPPFFLLVLLCFFLPFFAVTCGGADGFSGLPGFERTGDPADVSGVQLVTGQADQEIGEELSDFAKDAGSDLAGDVPVPGPTPTGLSDGLSAVGDTLAGQTDIPELGMSTTWAIAAAVVALLGIFLSALGGRIGAIMAIALGVVGAVLLFVLSAAFSSAINQWGQRVLQGEPRLGFWLAVGGFIVAAITGLIRLLLPPRAAAPAGWDQDPGPAPTAPVPPPPPESPPQ